MIKYNILFPDDSNPEILESPGYFVLLECSDKIELHFNDCDENLIYLMQCTNKLTLSQLLDTVQWLRSTKSFASKKLILKILNKLQSLLFDMSFYASGLCNTILSSKSLCNNDVYMLSVLLNFVQISKNVTFQLCRFMTDLNARNAVSKVLLKYCPSDDIAKNLVYYKIDEFPVATLILTNLKNRRPFHDHFPQLCDIFDYKDGFKSLSVDQMLNLYSGTSTQQQMLFRNISKSDFSKFLTHIHSKPHLFIFHFNPTFTNDFLSALNGHNPAQFLDLLYCASTVEFKVFCCKCISTKVIPSVKLVDILFYNCLFTNFTSLRNISKSILSTLPPQYFTNVLGTATTCIEYLDSPYPTCRESCIDALLLLNDKSPMPSLPFIFKSHNIPHFQSPQFILQCGYNLITILQNTPQTLLDGLSDEAIELNNTTNTDITKTWRQLRDIGQYISNHPTLFPDCHAFYKTVFTTIRHFGILSEFLPMYSKQCKLMSEIELHEQCTAYYTLIKQQSVQVNRLDGKYAGLGFLILCPLRVMQHPNTFLKIVMRDMPSTNTTILSCVFIFLNDPGICHVMVSYAPQLLASILRICRQASLLQWGGKLLHLLLKRMDYGIFEMMRRYSKVEEMLCKALFGENEDARLLGLIVFTNVDMDKKIGINDFRWGWLMKCLIKCGFSKVGKNRCLAARIIRELVVGEDVMRIEETDDVNFNHFVGLLREQPGKEEIIKTAKIEAGPRDSTEFKIENTNWNLLKVNTGVDGSEEESSDILMHYYKQGIIVDIPEYNVDLKTILEGNYAYEYAMYISKLV